MDVLLRSLNGSSQPQDKALDFLSPCGDVAKLDPTFLYTCQANTPLHVSEQPLIHS